MPELPSGWESVAVGELCEINPRHPSDLSDDLDVTFVPMAAVSEETGEIASSELRKYGEVRRGYTQFTEGDVLFAKITPCMENGKAAVARNLANGFGCGTTEFFVLRSRGAVLPDYLLRYLRLESFRRAARASMQGAVGQARVPKAVIENARIPLPPIAVQHRICQLLDVVTTVSRNARAALAGASKRMDRLRQSIFAAAFRGDLTADWREKNPDVEPASVLLDRIRKERRQKWEEAELAKMQAKGKTPTDDRWKQKYVEPKLLDSEGLPELPERWCWAKWGQISEWITYGFTRPMPHVSDGPAIITARHVSNGRINFVDMHKTTEDAFAALSEKDRPQPGDILITKDGSIGRAAVVEADLPRFCINQSVAVMFLRSCPLDRKYLLRLIEAPFAQAAIAEQARGMALPHLSITDFAELPFPLAPLDEQHKLVTKCEAALERVTAVERMITAADGRVSDLETAILAKAFRGELVPQDPNDEPASVLLERIRAQRAASEGQPNGKRRTKSRGREATSEPEPAAIAEASTPRLPIHERSAKAEAESPRLTIDHVSVEDILAAIRRVIDTGDRDRESLIRDVARELGFARTGTIIREAIDSAINTASRRLIIRSERGVFTLYSSSIDHYDKDELKQLFLSAIGTTWWDRDEAVRATARYLGFKRTGDKIDNAIRSVINGLIRQDRIERDGARIRRL